MCVFILVQLHGIITSQELFMVQKAGLLLENLNELISLSEGD